jgi:hypothetical protein
VSSDTPATPRQTTWLNADADKDEPSVVHLGPGALLLAVVRKDDQKEAAAILERGGDLPGKRIPLADMTEVVGQQETLSVTFRKEDGSTATEQATLADKPACDQAVAALADRLGPAWERTQRPVRFNPIALIFLAGCVGFAFLTWYCHSEAVQIAEGGKVNTKDDQGRWRALHGVLVWVEGLIGPLGILIVGGLLTGLALFFFLAGFLIPSVRTTLRPRPPGPAPTARAGPPLQC